MAERRTEGTQRGDDAGKRPDEDGTCDRESPTVEPSEEPRRRIKPVTDKIGEGRDNLSRRREWFQRRTGSSE